jgi:hypothetical protein
VTPKLLPLIASVALVGGLTAPSVANASTVSPRAETSVTIKTQNGEFWGYLTSPRPMRCADGRKVTLYKQAGSAQNPSVDKRMASDISSLSGSRYKWSTGTTGLRHGKFYARVGRTSDCRSDTSETVRASSTT